MTLSKLPIRRIAAAVLVLLTAAGAPANAADMDPYYMPKSGSPYDDPRYGDIYRHPPPPQRYSAPRYYEPAPTPYPPRDRYGYLEPMSPAPAYRERERRYGEPDGRCLHRGEIKRRLSERGWHEFRDVDLHGDVALLSARQASGNAYELRIDRCTGDVLGARLIESGGDRPYAWRERQGYRSH